MIRPDDRRQTQRLYAPLAAELDWTAADGAAHRGAVQALDISLTGLAVSGAEPIPLHSVVTVAVALPPTPAPLRLAATVVRVEARPPKQELELGLALGEVPLAAREALQEYLTRLAIGPLLEATIARGASDLHLLANAPPQLRINGQLQPLDERVVRAEDIPALLFSLLSHEQVAQFTANKELDLGLQYGPRHRFRLNVHQQRGLIEAAFRLINPGIATFEQLHLPPVIEPLCRLREGLVLITGPTGSGKTTTIAAMVNHINHHRREVIVTLERPIEYLLTNDRSIIKQREVGVDTHSFSAALRSSLRQDPDVIVIGELDDAETVRTAIIAAETGYLVLASFHAPNTIQAIDRLAGIVPPENRRQMLAQIAQCLQAVVAQQLLPRLDQPGRVLAAEVMTGTPAIRRIIRSDELYRLPTMIQTGGGHQMIAMKDSLRKLLESGMIDEELFAAYSGELSAGA